MIHKIATGIDYIGVAVVFFCHDGKGSFVMALRGNGARDEHGHWDIGGGRLEFGQSIEDALKKEIAEEYQSPVLVHEFLGFRDVHRTQNGKHTHWIALDYKVLVNREKVKNGEPHKFTEIGWFRLDALPKNLHSQLPTFFQRYQLELKTEAQ